MSMENHVVRAEFALLRAEFALLRAALGWAITELILQAAPRWFLARYRARLKAVRVLLEEVQAQSRLPEPETSLLGDAQHHYRMFLIYAATWEAAHQIRLAEPSGVFEFFCRKLAQVTTAHAEYGDAVGQSRVSATKVDAL